MKAIVFLLLTLPVFGQTLLQGVNANWKIIAYNKEINYFSWEYPAQNKVYDSERILITTGLINITEPELLLCLSSILNEFGNLPRGFALNAYNPGFRFETRTYSEYVYIYDYRSVLIKISKTKCRLLSTEIEKSLILINPELK